MDFEAQDELRLRPALNVHVALRRFHRLHAEAEHAHRRLDQLQRVRRPRRGQEDPVNPNQHQLYIWHVFNQACTRHAYSSILLWLSSIFLVIGVKLQLVNLWWLLPASISFYPEQALIFMLQNLWSRQFKIALIALILMGFVVASILLFFQIGQLLSSSSINQQIPELYPQLVKITYLLVFATVIQSFHLGFFAYLLFYYFA